MARNVEIICKYYQVRERANGEITENTFDLREWMLHVNQLDFQRKYKEANGVKGRLENLALVSREEEIYAFNFMRMEDVSTSYVLNINNPAEHVDIDIAADEYIARNTVCLYDPENGIIMIQCNRGSYSEKSIESYINEFYDEPVCTIVPIFENIDMLADSAEYMKLDVRLANIRNFVPTENTSFEKIVDGINRVEGLNAHIEISLGNARNARLNDGEVRRTLTDLYNNRGCVTSAKIKMSDDQISGIYDLFDNLSRDTIKCVVDENGGISFERMYGRMYDKYILEYAKTRVLRAVIQRNE